MNKIRLCTVAILILLCTMVIIVGDTFNVSAQVVSNMSAPSYILMDCNGNILESKNPHEKREVASICKLMTTLITLENIEKGNITLEDKFYASAYACDAEGSQAFLDAGKEYYVSDLLKSVIIASANDSAIVLAENIAGSEKQFVKIMNARAKELGMSNTKYSNSTGLPTGEQYSTAFDTAILLNEVSQFEIYKKDCQIWMDELVHESGRKTELVNTNRLIKYYNYCKTGKTGFTDEAGYCLSSTASKDNLNLTCVVLGCQSPADRFTDSVSLYNYGFANFASEKIIDSTVELDKTLAVKSGKETSLKLMPANDYYLTVKKTDKQQYSLEYDLPNDVKAPIIRGDKVGSVFVVVNNEKIAEVDIVAKDNIEKQDYLDIVNKIVNKYAIVK